MSKGLSDHEITKRRNRINKKVRDNHAKEIKKLSPIQYQELEISILDSRIKTVKRDLESFDSIAIENKLKVMEENRKKELIILNELKDEEEKEKKLMEEKKNDKNNK